MIACSAVFPVRGEGAAIAATTADVAIAFLFFLYGTRLSPKAAVAGLFQWKLHIAVLLSTFALFPVLGVGISHFLSGALPSPLMVGVVLLCLMPSTVQSSIAFTSIAGGKDRKSTRRTPVTNAHLVCRLLLEKKQLIYQTHNLTTSITNN